jgi:hypothetical protein
MTIWSNTNLYYDDVTRGFRWPAYTADGAAKEHYGKNRTYPVVKDCRMGALLAIPADIDLESLGFATEPGKILAKCFQDYGAYVVDDSAWDCLYFTTEWGPDGRFRDEFAKNWGFPWNSSNANFKGDIQKIWENLHVVVNNSEATPGGGGKPRQALAPPFQKILPNK